MNFFNAQRTLEFFLHPLMQSNFVMDIILQLYLSRYIFNGGHVIFILGVNSTVLSVVHYVSVE